MSRIGSIGKFIEIMTILILVGYKAGACANNIQLTTRANTWITDDIAYIELYIRNDGNMPAISLSPMLSLPDLQLFFPNMGTLKSGASYRSTAQFPLNNPVPSTLYAPLKVNYMDVTGYESSALLLISFRDGDRDDSGLSVILQPVMLKRGCVTSHAEIHNPANSPRIIQLQIHAADIFHIETAHSIIKVDAEQTQEIPIEVCLHDSNARGNHNYYLVATTQGITTEIGGAAGSLISVAASGLINDFFSNRQLIIVLCVILLTLLIAIFLYNNIAWRR